MLKKRDDKYFDEFCEALEATDQNDVVKSCFPRHRVCNSRLCFFSDSGMLRCTYSVKYEQQKVRHDLTKLSSSNRKQPSLSSAAYIDASTERSLVRCVVIIL